MLCTHMLLLEGCSNALETSVVSIYDTVSVKLGFT